MSQLSVRHTVQAHDTTYSHPCQQSSASSLFTQSDSPTPAPSPPPRELMSSRSVPPCTALGSHAQLLQYPIRKVVCDHQRPLQSSPGPIGRLLICPLRRKYCATFPNDLVRLHQQISGSEALFTLCVERCGYSVLVRAKASL